MRGSSTCFGSREPSASAHDRQAVAEPRAHRQLRVPGNQNPQQLVVRMALLQHGLKSRRLHFTSKSHAGFLVMPPLLEFLENSLPQHQLFQPAQPLLHRLMSFQFDLDQWILASAYSCAFGTQTINTFPRAGLKLPPPRSGIGCSRGSWLASRADVTTTSYPIASGEWLLAGSSANLRAVIH